MIANTTRLRVMILFVFLICLACVCYSQDATAEATTSTNISSTQNDEKNEEEASEDESTGLFDAKGMVQEIGDELKEERIAALKEINRQRKETLEYLSQERKAIMIDIEAIGDRIVSNSISESERLIDHLLIRILQVAGVLILALCIVGLLSFRVIMRNKNES